MNFTQTTLKIASEIETENGIDLAELVSILKVEWKHDKIDFYEEYLKKQATTILCTSEYYSIGNGIFQKFEDMSREDQMKALAKAQKEAETCQQKYVRFRKQMTGQIIMEFKEDGTVEYREVV